MKRSPRKQYDSVKAQRARFNECAEKFTQRFAILVGIERLGGYFDSKGVYFPPACSLHVDGLCFRVESLTHGIAFLQGVQAGFEFSASKGSGFVTRAEVESICRKLIEGGNHV